MKNLSKIMLWMAVLPLLFVMSCKDDDPAPATGAFGELSTYLQANSLDLDDILSGWIEKGIPASVDDVPAFVDKYYIMDIRKQEHYDDGHIQTAVNSSLGSIVADAKAANPSKPILVVCYSGQSAAHAVVALRLSGFEDTKTLKWGMSGWNSENDVWSGNTSSFAVGHDNWTLPASPATAADNNYPEISSTATGAQLLEERVTFMTEKGFQGVLSADVVATPSDFFINNYWGTEHNELYGHISTAIRNNTHTLENGGFKDLDPSKTVVTYCWTGQTSSIITAYLTVLGYEAKSLKFGSNSMIYSELQSGKWAPPAVDLPKVKTE